MSFRMGSVSRRGRYGAASVDRTPLTSRPNGISSPIQSTVSTRTAPTHPKSGRHKLKGRPLVYTPPLSDELKRQVEQGGKPGDK
ncbi:hypothetical protein WSK_4148 [Novosphingobium sp. Rr 2-17]|nr:hypothetical protein WSK_4148 [Novosphingobium sp. Rr 2-17]